MSVVERLIIANMGLNFYPSSCFKFFSVHNWIGHFRVSKHQLLIKIIYWGISFVSIQIGSQILYMVIQVYPQLTLNNDVMARGSEGVLIKFL